MNEWLTDEEVERLTGYKRKACQLRELRQMGFGHRIHVRSNGSFVVDRVAPVAQSEQKVYSLDMEGFSNAS